MAQFTRLERLAIKEAEAQGVSISELWKHYQNTHGTLRKTLCESQLEFGKDKELAGRSRSYLSQLDWLIADFVAKAGRDRLVCDLNLGDIRKWVYQGSAHTSKTRKSRLSTYLNWCKRQGYTNEVLTDRLENITIDAKEPTVLENADMAKLLEVSRLSDPDFLEYFWLAGALGIRNSECKKLRVDCLKESGAFVEVGASIAKTRSRRLVKCVVASPLKSGGQIVVGWRKNYRRRFDAIRSASMIKEWDRNVLRHTAASHLLNYYSDENKAASHLGHTPDVLHRSYRGLVTPAQSEEFWALWS